MLVLCGFFFFLKKCCAELGGQILQYADAIAVGQPEDCTDHQHFFMFCVSFLIDELLMMLMHTSCSELMHILD
jgi:hypothetical protein